MTDNPGEAAPHARTRARAILLGGAVAIAVSIGAVALLTDSPTETTVDSTIASGSTTTSTRVEVTSTTFAERERSQLTADFSPFVRQDLVSSLNSIPKSPAYAEAATSIYVDPVGGNDAAAGTLDAPVATLEAARALARPALRSQTGDVVVYLRGGVHPRSDPFVLTFADSGRGEFDMVYRSFPGEQAIIEGGVPVTGWRQAFDSVVVADVPSQVADMRQFFAAGQRQPRARSSEAIGTAVEFIKDDLYGQQRNVAMTVSTDLVAEFAKPEDLELVYIGTLIEGHGVLRGDGSESRRPSWKSHRLPVTGAREVAGGLTRLDIGGGALYQASERGYEPLELLPADPFFFENAIELLDEPGEWYFDPEARLLYWWPPDDAALADAWAPVTETLLNIDGTPSRPVRNVRIEGIAIRHAAYTLPNETGSVVSQAASWFTGWRPADWMTFDGQRHSFLDRARPPGLPGAAVQIDSARDIAFTGDVFTELGAVGVMVHNDVRRISFDSNLFVDVSAEALVAGHPDHDEIDEPMEGPVAKFSFTNNIVDRAGAEFYASTGIMVTKVAGAEISHNLFRDLPYSAISLGWGWDHNPASTVHRAVSVENNYFEDVVNVLYDGAPIYLLGPVAEVGAARSDFVTISGNFANNSDAKPQFKAPGDAVDPAFAKRPGIQLDEGSRNVVVSNNVFAGATVWLQVTAWREHRNEPNWLEELALVTTDNWSDVVDSEPADLDMVGAQPAAWFSPDDLPESVLAIIGAAGLEPGVDLPPLP